MMPFKSQDKSLLHFSHSYVPYLSVSIGSNMKIFNCVRCIYDSVVLWVSRPSFHLSVTMVDYVNMVQNIVKRFQPSGGHVHSSFSVSRSQTNARGADSRGASLLVLFSLYLPFLFSTETA